MLMYRTTMPDGSKWDVPAEFIARHRASYYVLRDIKDKEMPILKESDIQLLNDEIKIAMDDTYMIMDWAKNNMDWKDVVDVAVCAVPASALDVDEGWSNGEYEFINK